MFLLFTDNTMKVMLLGAVLLGRSLEARQRLKAARGLQGLFDVRPDQVTFSMPGVAMGETRDITPSAGLCRMANEIATKPSDI